MNSDIIKNKEKNEEKVGGGEEEEEEAIKLNEEELKKMRTGIDQHDDLNKQKNLQIASLHFSEKKENFHSMLNTHSNEAYISYYTPKTKHEQDEHMKETRNRSMDTESGYPSRGESTNNSPISSPTAPEKEEQSPSSDGISMLVRYYRRMPMLSKIRFVELFFIVIVSAICIFKSDIFHLVILFLIFTNGLQASFMISHLTYKIIMLITAISLVVKYALQLPVFRICVNYGEEYYLTFLQTCVSEGEINYSIFQPYSLLGVTGMTRDGRVRVSMFSDVMIMVLCIMMRSILKSYGLWEMSLVRLVINDVSTSQSSVKTITTRHSIETSRMRII